MIGPPGYSFVTPIVFERKGDGRAAVSKNQWHGLGPECWLIAPPPKPPHTLACTHTHANRWQRLPNIQKDRQLLSARSRNGASGQITPTSHTGFCSDLEPFTGGRRAQSLFYKLWAVATVSAQSMWLLLSGLWGLYWFICSNIILQKPTSGHLGETENMWNTNVKRQNDVKNKKRSETQKVMHPPMSCCQDYVHW